MTDLTSNEINVGAALARIEGRIDKFGVEMSSGMTLLAEQMRAGDAMSAKLMELIQYQMTAAAADLGKLQAEVHELSAKTDTSITTVRTDLEKRLDVLEDWKSRLVGMGIVVGAVAGFVASVAVKAMGG